MGLCRWLLFVGVSALTGAACTSFSAGPSPEVTDGGANGTEPVEEDAAGIDPGSPTPDPLDPQRACADGGFCDDFEGPEAPPRGWSSASPNGQSIFLIDGAGVASSVSFQVTLYGGTTRQVFLRNNHGSGKRAWRYRLSFDAKAEVPAGNLNGPRLLTTAPMVDAGPSGSDNRLDLYLGFTKDKVQLSTYSPACKSLACGKPAFGTAPPRDNEWHHYVLEIDANGGDPVAKVYGRVRFSMDGVSKADAPLPYPLSRARTRSTLFGVSYADATARGMLILDNTQIEIVDED